MRPLRTAFCSGSVVELGFCSELVAVEQRWVHVGAAVAPTYLAAMGSQPPFALLVLM